ncbi:hypothetical protein LF817_19280 [Halobacillus sp. A1]|uniref:hypothetical protein n=1 Tax=Halobacillus sp. A1 TaxID=2880262 RepID=UPI0020A641CC|nr:hypothetical protein [Halobacillus sp. A1]MCP3033470.1 hypothetical protein [Halobacillus sp. A1]
MDIVMVFLLLSTVTPFLFIKLKKLPLAILQSVLLVGMWMYYFQAVFNVAPPTLSPLWLIFYAGLFVSQIGWIMFIIYVVKTQEEKLQKSYQ